MKDKAERRQDIRDTVSAWTHGPDWKTWVAHTVFGLIIALVAGLIAAALGHSGEWYGAAVAIGYYLIREIEQIVYNIVGKKPNRWFDNFMDVFIPTVVIIILVGLIIWIGDL
jgi:4-hydroxybenzoate polyprenyltransferase